MGVEPTQDYSSRRFSKPVHYRSAHSPRFSIYADFLPVSREYAASKDIPRSAYSPKFEIGLNYTVEQPRLANPDFGLIIVFHYES